MEFEAQRHRPPRRLKLKLGRAAPEPRSAQSEAKSELEIQNPPNPKCKEDQSTPPLTQKLLAKLTGRLNKFVRMRAIDK